MVVESSEVRRPPSGQATAHRQWASRISSHVQYSGDAIFPALCIQQMTLHCLLWATKTTTECVKRRRERHRPQWVNGDPTSCQRQQRKPATQPWNARDGQAAQRHEAALSPTSTESAGENVSHGQHRHNWQTGNDAEINGRQRNIGIEQRRAKHTDSDDVTGNEHKFREVWQSATNQEGAVKARKQNEGRPNQVSKFLVQIIPLNQSVISCIVCVCFVTHCRSYSRYSCVW